MMHTVSDIQELDAGAVRTTVHGQDFYQKYICRNSMKDGITSSSILRNELGNRIRKSTLMMVGGKLDKGEGAILETNAYARLSFKYFHLKKQKVFGVREEIV